MAKASKSSRYSPIKFFYVTKLKTRKLTHPRSRINNKHLRRAPKKKTFTNNNSPNFDHCFKNIIDQFAPNLFVKPDDDEVNSIKKTSVTY